VGAAGEHDIRFAATDDFRGFTNCLAGGGAGCEAIEIWSLSVEQGREVGGGHVGFEFELEPRIHAVNEALSEVPEIDTAASGCFGDERHELQEVLLSFAGTEIDTEPSGAEVGVGMNTGIFDSLPGGRSRIERCVLRRRTRRGFPPEHRSHNCGLRLRIEWESRWHRNA
jgi:hypothetical protein